MDGVMTRQVEILLDTYRRYLPTLEIIPYLRCLRLRRYVHHSEEKKVPAVPRRTTTMTDHGGRRAELSSVEPKAAAETRPNSTHRLVLVIVNTHCLFSGVHPPARSGEPPFAIS
jgi:hypothetical protein